MIKFTIPVKTLSPNAVKGNTRLAAIIRAGQKKKEREAARLCTMAALAEAFGLKILSNGYVVTGDAVRVTFTRVSAGTLDPVNLCAALKHVEDGVAEVCKIDDGSPFWKAEFAQRKCKRGEHSVDVEIA